VLRKPVVVPKSARPANCDPPVAVPDRLPRSSAVLQFLPAGVTLVGVAFLAD